MPNMFQVSSFALATLTCIGNCISIRPSQAQLNNQCTLRLHIPSEDGQTLAQIHYRDRMGGAGRRKEWVGEQGSRQGEDTNKGKKE